MGNYVEQIESQNRTLKNDLDDKIFEFQEIDRNLRKLTTDYDRLNSERDILQNQ